MGIDLAFAVGIGNLGPAQRPRVPMKVLVHRIQDRFVSEGIPAQIIGFFGHTGNFAIRSQGPTSALAKEIEKVLGTPVTIFRLHDVKRYVEAVKRVSTPKLGRHLRSTPGLVFHVCGNRAPLKSVVSDLADFLVIDQFAVGVWKHDILGADRRLDPNARHGGWGALTHELSRVTGGQWTARSLRSVCGLMARAQTWE